MKQLMSILNNKAFQIGALLYVIKWFLDSLTSSKTSANISPVDKLDTKNSSISDTKAYEIAENLYSSMNGFGTDEYLLDKILTSLSYSDYNRVYNQFGLRKYDKGLGTDAFNVLVGQPVNLTNWIFNEDREIYDKHSVRLRFSLT